LPGCSCASRSISVFTNSFCFASGLNAIVISVCSLGVSWFSTWLRALRSASALSCTCQARIRPLATLRVVTVNAREAAASRISTPSGIDTLAAIGAVVTFRSIAATLLPKLSFSAGMLNVYSVDGSKAPEIDRRPVLSQLPPLHTFMLASGGHTLIAALICLSTTTSGLLYSSTTSRPSVRSEVPLTSHTLFSYE
jgi:hypothetical protein